VQCVACRVCDARSLSCSVFCSTHTLIRAHVHFVLCECRLCHLPFAVCVTCVLVSGRKSEQEREQERKRESKRESDAACRLLSVCGACWCLSHLYLGV